MSLPRRGHFVASLDDVYRDEAIWKLRKDCFGLPTVSGSLAMAIYF